MTFSTMSRYIWGDAPSDPDLSLPLHELVFFAHNDEAFRNALTVKWIRDYCIINRIPLIEECKPFMQSLSQDDDMRAVTGVYYLEVLDGLSNFCYARENLLRMKTFNTKTEFCPKIVIPIETMV